MQAVILAGGPLTDYTMVQVPADALLICADRGVRYAEQLGLHPDVMLGDFDSWQHSSWGSGTGLSQRKG